MATPEYASAASAGSGQQADGPVRFAGAEMRGPQVVSRGEGVGVIRAEYASAVGQILPEYGHSPAALKIGEVGHSLMIAGRQRDLVDSSRDFFAVHDQSG